MANQQAYKLGYSGISIGASAAAKGAFEGRARHRAVQKVAKRANRQENATAKAELLDMASMWLTLARSVEDNEDYRDSGDA